jgi:hypothetical protein
LDICLEDVVVGDIGETASGAHRDWYYEHGKCCEYESASSDHALHRTSLSIECLASLTNLLDDTLITAP